MKQPDSNIDESLPGAAEVKQAYAALPHADVPAELDTKVLARAREAADKTTVVALKRTALRRWAIPLSAAASVLVAMTVVYEMHFHAPPQVVAIHSDAMEQQPVSPAPQDATPAVPASEGAAKKAEPRAKSSAALASVAPGSGPAGLVNPQIAVPMEAPISIAPPAPEIVVQLPAATNSIAAATEERIANADTPRMEKSEQETKRAEEKRLSDSSAARAADTPAAPSASGQMLGMTRRLDASVAEAKPSLEVLGKLAGHYQYVAYKVVKLSGEVMSLKDQGYAAASLDVDAQGTLKQTLADADGKVVTRTAKILRLKLEGRSGYWMLLWSDMTYPVESSISFADDKLSSRTQFEELADEARFGNVELATLKRAHQ